MITLRVIGLFHLAIISVSSQTVSLPSPLPLPPTEPGCFSLKDSNFCGSGFGEYYISNKTIVNGVPTTDIVAFDRAMGFYFGSPSDIKEINTQFGCLGGAGWDGIYEPPYRASFTCRSLLLRDPNALACNENNPVAPLCRSTCLVYTKGWETVIRNETACPAPPDQEEIKIRNTLAWCDVAPFNGTVGNCIDSKEDQETTCGFALPLQFPYLCTFCQFSNDACCRSESARSCGITIAPNSHVSLICSIVFGCLGGIGLVVGVIFFCKRRKLDKTDIKNVEIEKTKTSGSTSRLNSSVSSVSECVCEFTYEATLPDELSIESGDNILILWMFDDGWAVGRNLTQGGEGAFPLACVVRKMADSGCSSVTSVFGNSFPRRVSSKRNSNRPKSDV
ncbi:hypothetical protein K7432_015418 [Basidiobolus ranarum]|uniref:SH3 domain-containing protein n=1 Tax=Basidiobolus ranarum TaxID=34480 RepID=A0ABR2WG72_9FUNG